MKVVILVLNEGLWIRGAVESVTAGASDVIVDDGGSSDGTVAVAGSAWRTGDHGPPRAGVADSGRRPALGDWLVFLHADTRLADGWSDAVPSLYAHSATCPSSRMCGAPRPWLRPARLPRAARRDQRRALREFGFVRTTFVNWLVIVLGSAGFPRQRPTLFRGRG